MVSLYQNTKLHFTLAFKLLSSNCSSYTEPKTCNFQQVCCHLVWRRTGGRELGSIGAGGGREAGGDGAGCGSHVRAGGGKRMRDIKFFNDFLVPF